MAFDYDLFVIGGGSGGVRAARVAAATGASVALAEEYRMGGTCVIRGCVPKKLMVFASTYPDLVEDAQAYGWDASIGDFSWDTFSGKMRSELDRLEGVYRKLLDGSGVEIFDGRATLKDKNTVAVGDKVVTAKTILIASGGHPVRPDMPGAELGLVSNDIFLMDALPKSVLIIGGGYIACEFACILNGLGVATTQFYRGAQVLRGFDDEARGLLSESMKEAGVDLHLGTNIVEMKKSGDAIWVKSTDGTEKEYDHVIFATGRAANTAGMGLEDAGIALGRKGEIVVDDYSRTSVDSVFAIGDVTGRVELTPVAIREAMAFVQTVFHDTPTPVDHDLIPSAVFTTPEMGTIGLSEEAAAAQEPIHVFATSFRPMQQSFAGRASRVLMKLIVSQKTDVVLGCHIVADHAGEMIQLAGIAVKMGATKAQFDSVCAVHPTMSEELVTMREPVRST